MSRFLVFALFCTISLAICASSYAQVPPTGPAAPPKITEGKPIPVPAGTADELIKWVQEVLLKTKLFDMAPDGTSGVDNSKAVVAAADQVAEKLLAMKLTEEQLENAVEIKMMAVMTKGQMEQKMPLAEVKALHARIVKLGGTKIAEDLQVAILTMEFQEAMAKNDKEAAAATGKKFLASIKDEKLSGRKLYAVMQISNQLAAAGESKIAVELLETALKNIGDAPDEQMQRLVEMVKGSLVKIQMIGKPMKIFGKFLDGTEYKASDYKGKVVLVDFWASWCGPCHAEAKNIKALYENYHSKGFEVIGINCDDTQKAAEASIKQQQLPWKNIFFTGKKEEMGFNNPMAKLYGINSIPQIMLIGKDGNVISATCRGDQIAVLLEEQLGK